MNPELTSTPGIVALVAAAIALVAIATAAVVLVRLRRLRADQRAVLGDSGAQDLVGHAAALDVGFQMLREEVLNAIAHLEGRVAVAEKRLDGAIAHCGLIRYDAYNEMSGRQSTTIALLDSSRSGVVLSSIHHRDQARLYAKQVSEGRGELQLSPEEEEAVRLALG